MTVLLQISWRMIQWRNFENLLVFDEVMCRLRWLTFFGPPCIYRSLRRIQLPMKWSQWGRTYGRVNSVAKQMDVDSNPSSAKWINKMHLVTGSGEICKKNNTYSSRPTHMHLARYHPSTRNTLDCDQSNYCSRIVFPTYLLNLVKPEIAPFDPPTPKTPS